MSDVRYRPRRRLRSEIFPILSVLALAVALYAAFPSGAIDFLPRKPSASVSVYNAFVSLDAEQEAELLKAARSSWQSDSASRRGIRADLLSCGEPSAEALVTVGLCPSVRTEAETSVDYECEHVLSGAEAAAPAALAPVADGSVSEPAFPKTDLLKLN